MFATTQATLGARTESLRLVRRRAEASGAGISVPPQMEPATPPDGLEARVVDLRPRHAVRRLAILTFTIGSILCGLSQSIGSMAIAPDGSPSFRGKVPAEVFAEPFMPPEYTA